MLPSTVSIVAQVHLWGKPFEQSCLLVGQCRAESSAHAGHAKLVQRHHIHVALHQHHTFQMPLLPQQVSRIDPQAFVKHWRI